MVQHGQRHQTQIHQGKMDKVVEIVVLDIFLVEMMVQIVLLKQNHGMVQVGQIKSLCLKKKQVQVTHQLVA